MRRPGFSITLPFSRQPRLCLGMDIGSHAVKVCDLAATRKGYRLNGLGSARLPAGAVEDGVLQDPDAVATAVTTLLDNLKSKKRKVAISLSGYSVIAKKITLAQMSDEEMQRHILTEAEQYLPFDVADVYLDFQNLHTGGDGERTEVMLVAAKREVMDGYLELLRGCGLEPSVIDVDAFALENAYTINYDPLADLALVDIGAGKMSINVLHNGVSAQARDVALGSSQLSARIEGRLEIDFESAEELKLGIRQPDDAQRAELEDIFTEAAQQWVEEIGRALDLYLQKDDGNKIDRIVLSGGGSKIVGFDQLLARHTGIPCDRFDPFARIAVDSGKVDPAYLQQVAPEMAIAVGLATRPEEV